MLFCILLCLRQAFIAWCLFLCYYGVIRIGSRGNMPKIWRASSFFHFTQCNRSPPCGSDISKVSRRVCVICCGHQVSLWFTCIDWVSYFLCNFESWEQFWLLGSFYSPLLLRIKTAAYIRLGRHRYPSRLIRLYSYQPFLTASCEVPNTSAMSPFVNRFLPSHSYPTIVLLGRMNGCFCSTSVWFWVSVRLCCLLHISVCLNATVTAVVLI